MPVEFEVKGSSKTIQEFDAFLMEWAAAFEKKSGGPAQITPLFQPDRFYLFGSGSIRGCTFSPSASFFKGGRVEVRLNVMSSRADWRLCYSILETLVREQHAAVSDESGRVLPLSDLSPASANQRGLAAIQADLRFLRHFLQEQSHDYLRLPNLQYDLVITREQSAGWDEGEASVLEFEQVLSSQAARLAFCRHANPVTLKDGLTVNAIGFEAAIYPVSDYAGLSHSGTPPQPGQPGDLVFVKFTEFLEAFREKIEKVKENPPGFYLPGIDLSDPGDLAAHNRLLQLGQNELPRKG